MRESEDAIRVLHVDDQTDLAELAATFLERENARLDVRIANDVGEGLALLATEPIDAVVSDYEMPDRDGIEFLRAVREDHPDLPFVLFTGKGSEEVAGKAISAGVTDYLQKRSGTEQYELLANRLVKAVDAVRTERTLSERTRRLETLISNLPGMVYRCRNEPDWPMTTVEGEVEALAGYSAETLERNEVRWGNEVIHSEDREAVWNAVQSALDEHESFEVTYRIVTREGATKWVWERGRGVYDDGELVAVEGFITDVTDRKRREERLERTMARLEALFENSPDMINVHDAEGTIQEVNPRFCEETGYDEAQLVGMKIWEVDTQLDRSEAAAIWESMAIGDRREVETVFERRDGSRFPVRVHLSRLDSDGNDRFIVSSRNITERKRREEKLEQLRERTRELTYTETVTETTRLAIAAADDIIGAPLSSVHLVNADRTRLEPSVVTESVEKAFDELPVYERSAGPGTRSHIAWEAFEGTEPIRLDDVGASSRLSEATPAGSVVLHPIGDRGVFIISAPEPHAFTETDVLLVEILANYLETALDRVEREETLRTREHRLEQLHDATRDLVRAESREAVANRVVAAAEDILGFSVTLFRLYDPDRNGLVPVAQSDEVGEILSDRETFFPDSGSLNWECFESGTVRVYDDIETVSSAVDKDSGLRSLMIVPIGSHGTLSVAETVPNAFDATAEFLARLLATAAETALDELEHERELLDSRDELMRQNERLEEFARVVSHDLRNPLNVAEGRLDLAREECESDQLDHVDRALSRMGELIGDLLVLAHDGDEVGDRVPVDLATLAERSWENVDTPDAATLVVDTEATIRADRSRLAQLFENLMRNAIEHGGADVTVTVGDLDGGFYVADDGHGVSETDRKSVFDAGFSTSVGGTGFGLSIVRQIAEAHGWTVRLAEADSGGARFEITGV